MNETVTQPLDLEDDFSATIASQLGPRKPVQKPDISRLPSAIDEDGRPLFKAGDKIVIERYSGILQGNPYLDTRTFRVKSVDMETGLVALYDEVLVQNAYDNWKTGVETGQVYKFATGTPVSSKKKRGRPRKDVIGAEAKPVELGPDGKPIKRRRGRPPGAKNRSKDEIRAEKMERSAARAARKAGR